jgi:hypothetical protein
MEEYRIQYTPTGNTKPSHVLIFEGVAKMGETERTKTGPTIKDALRDIEKFGMGGVLVNSITPTVMLEED